MKHSLLLLASVALTMSLFAQRRAVQHPPITAAARLSAEFPVSDITYAEGAPGYRPGIVAGPHQALVFWSNGMVRVDESGQPLDAIPLLSGLMPWGPQDAVWTGEEYIVLYTRWNGTKVVITLVRIGTDGHVGTPADIDTPDAPDNNVLMAMSGDELAIVYTTRPEGSAFVVHALIVSSDAVTRRVDDLGPMYVGGNRPGQLVASPYGWLLLTPNHFDLIALHGAGVIGGSLPHADLAGVWNGSEYVVAASDVAGIVAYPISVNGVVGESSVVHPKPATASRSVLPAIAWNGSEYRVIWQEEYRDAPFTGVYGTSTYDLYAARVTPGLIPLNEQLLREKIWVTDGRFVPGTDDLGIAAFGSNFVPVFMTGPENTVGVRYPYAGMSPQLVSHAAAWQSGTLVATRDSARVFWSQQNDGVSTASIDPQGHHGDTKSVATADVPLVAFNGVDTLGLSSADGQIYVSIFDAAGNLATQTTLASGRYVNALDCNAHDCAAVWSDGVRNYFQRITPNGMPIDQPLELAQGFDGLSGRDDEYLLVFRWSLNLYATRFADGKLSDATDLHADSSGPIALASKPDGWLVVASRTAIRLDANAQILGRTNVATGDYPSAAWAGRDWIIASDRDGDIYATRLHADGTVETPFGIAATPDIEHGAVVRSAGDGRTAVSYTRNTKDLTYGMTTRLFVRWIGS